MILLLSSPHMRAAAILGLGCSAKDLQPFQTDNSVVWQVGIPESPADADVILLFGGDGTIHRHLGQFVNLGRPVLIVPAGSGNDFARALGLRKVRDSLNAWKAYCAGATNVRAIDLGVITQAESLASSAMHGGSRAGVPAPQGKYFCCVAGVGIDGEVARRANKLPRWIRGHGGYAASFIPTIFTFAPFPMKILTGERESNEQWDVRSDQSTLLAAFANTPTYGGGMKIAPQAKMDDGLLDVCVVGAVSALKLASMFPTVYSGKHLSIREVSYFQAPRVRVETGHPIDVYADGEFVCRTPVEVSIERAALKVVAPSE